MKNDKLHILLVEDDLLSRLSLKSRLEGHAIVTEAESANLAQSLIQTKQFNLAFVDMDLESPLAGLEVVKSLSDRGIHTIVLSAREDDEVIEAAYKLGCNDYLSKPFSKSSIESVIKKYQHSKVNLLENLQKILITNDSDIKNQLKIIEQAIFGDHPILITGETGTGKTFLAKYIHELIGKEKPFVHLNCSEISENLIESELFGHVKGSFTGAHKDKKGLMELASGGVLFLDEIATLPMVMQKKLLKAIEEKTFYPVGSEKSMKSDFRLISATCENLQNKVDRGEFREDFYFRIQGFNVYLKSLRERKLDLDNLINHFLKQNKRRIVLNSEAREALIHHNWPGNVRELQKVIEVLRSSEKGIIQKKDLNGLLNNCTMSDHRHFNLRLIREIGLPAYLEKLEAEIVEQVLIENGDKVRKTLADLKLSNNSFYRIMTNLKAKGSHFVETR